MQKYLISFLGRSSRKDGSYRTTVYEMPEGPSKPTAYFGFLMQQRLKPDHMVILGTNGSMWDGLLNDLDVDAAVKAPFIDGLMESVEQQTVTQAMLDAVMTAINAVSKCQYQLLLIPCARNEGEQLTLLSTIADAIADQAEVTMDITHGFRHMPMMGYAAMQYLQAIKPDLTLSQMCYGEYNDDLKKGQLVDLTGILHIQQWLNAATLARNTGDLTDIAKLIAQPSIAQDLAKASFYLSVHRPSQARTPLKKVREALATEQLSGAAQLLKPVLLKQTDWVNEDYNYQRQSAQAFHAMSRKDYLRASMYAFEAYLTRKIRETATFAGQEDNFDVRKTRQEELDKDKTFRKSAEGQSYLLLRNLRNALAHGGAGSQADVQVLLNDQIKLETELTRLLATLLK